MTRSWPKVLLALAISFILPECKQAAPLRPQFAYIANSYSGLVSAYSIGTNGRPDAGTGFGIRRCRCGGTNFSGGGPRIQVRLRG